MAGENEIDRWIPLILIASLVGRYEEDDFPYREELLFDLMRTLDKQGETRLSPETRRILERLLLVPRLRGSRRERTRELVQEEINRQLGQDSPSSQIVSRFIQSKFQAYLSQDQSGRREFERITNQKLRVLETALSEVRAASDSNERHVAELNTSSLHTREALAELVWRMSSNVNFPEAMIVRHVPARIYLSDDPPDATVQMAIAKAIEDLAGAADLLLEIDLPGEPGSWWKRFVLRTKNALTCDEVQEKVGKLGRAFESRHINKPEAEANKHQAEAAAALIKSLETTKQACIQVGSLLVVKQTTSDGSSSVLSRTLTADELARLEENQSMLREPNKILEWLQHGGAARSMALLGRTDN